MKMPAFLSLWLVVLVLAACTPIPPSTATALTNPFIGSWAQSKLSDHALGMGICGNYQKLKFMDNGSFLLTNDYSGIYEKFNLSNATTKSLDGTYTIKNEKQIELVFKIDGQKEVWNYVFTENNLTMSFKAPDEYGGGYIPCYFANSGQ